MRVAEDAERQRIAEIEAREAEEERLKEEERLRKKQKEKEKIDRQKAEGIYLTKAQKQKKQLAAQRLAATLNAGGIVVAATESETPTKKGNNLYDDRKKKGKGKNTQKEIQPGQENQQLPKENDDEEIEDWEKVDDKKDADQSLEAIDNNDEKKEEPPESSGDEWDADSDDDDDDKLDELAKRLAKVQASDESIDLIEIEKRKEQERLRELGLKRAEQERIEAERRAIAEAEQHEEDRKAMMARQLREDGKKKRLQQEKDNLGLRSPDDLRCPIVVIMGCV